MAECKLWILRPIPNLQKGDNPWDPWYDKSFGFVVRADSETQAREMASGGDENRGSSPWMDEKYSTCEELLPDGDRGVVMQDFHSA